MRRGRKGPLPPAAVEAWYKLAAVVVRGIKDPEELEAWRKWAHEREHAWRQASSQNAGKTRSMGRFRDIW